MKGKTYQFLLRAHVGHHLLETPHHTRSWARLVHSGLQGRSGSSGTKTGFASVLHDVTCSVRTLVLAEIHY